MTITQTRPTRLDDLLDIEFLAAEIDAGNVRVRTHPDDDALRIFNYTEQAQYSKHWNEVTTQCRGLIVDGRTQRVLARPFDKFFNVGEHGDAGSTWIARHSDDQIRAVDKMDGSLGIYYVAPDGLPAIATRGSFTSEQALHATELLRTRYSGFAPRRGWTALFEIVYPENRIVLDYGDLDDLVLLGLRNIETGRIVGPDCEGFWPGPRAEILPPSTFAEALAFGDRTNREGMVVTFLASGLMVKIKQEDYVALHRLVTGLNERVIWEHLSTHHGEIGDLIEAIPDEFHGWVDRVADDLWTRFEVIQGRAHHAYHEVIGDVRHNLVEDARHERRLFAARVRDQYPDLAPFLFQLLDGRDISASIWKTLKPKGQTESLMNRTEDNS